MTDAVCIKIKTQGGEITTLQVAELIEVDGRSYIPPEDHMDYLEVLQRVLGSLQRIETAVCLQEPPAEED